MNSFFLAETTWGTFLHSDPESGEILHCQLDLEQDKLNPVYVFTPSDLPAVAFFISEFPGPNVLRGESWPGRLKGIGLRRQFGARTAVFAEGHARLFVAAEPIGEGSRCGRIVMDRQVAGPWETFRLVDASSVPSSVSRVAAQLAPWLRHPMGGAGFLAALREEDFDADIAQAFASFISADEFTSCARELVLSPEIMAKLSLASYDPWASRALPGLAAWLASGRAEQRRPAYIETDLDVLESSYRDSLHPTVFGALNSAARSSVLPEKDLCIVTTARNEGIYLIDWIAYHRSVGVEKIFVYTNDNDDGSAELLEILNEYDFIDLIYNETGPKTSPQYKSYGHAFQVNPITLNYKWAAVIDLDEFIHVNREAHDSLIDYIRWQEIDGADAILLSWSIHGPSSKSKWDETHIIDRFERAWPDPSGHVKSLMRPARFRHNQCHYPYDVLSDPRLYKNANGSVGRPACHVPSNFDHAWIAHYVFKSAEEFLARRVRNRGDSPVTFDINESLISERLAFKFVEAFTRNDGFAFLNLAWPDAAWRKEARRMRDISVIRHAETVCRTRYLEHVEAVKKVLAATPRFIERGSPENMLFELAMGQAQSCQTENLNEVVVS